MSTQEWTPDTMPGTTIIQEVDYSQDPPVVMFKGFKSKSAECSAHKAKDDTELHDKILAENQSKNRVIGAIKDIYPDHEPDWVFDGDRKLVVSFPNGKPNTIELEASFVEREDITSEVIIA